MTITVYATKHQSKLEIEAIANANLAIELGSRLKNEQLAYQLKQELS